MSDIPEPNRVVQQELLSVLNRRRSSYGVAVVRSVLFRKGGVWQNSLTRVDVLRRDEPLEPELNYDFGDIVAVRASLSLDSLETAVREIFSGKIRFGTLPEFSFKGYFQTFGDSFRHSGDEYLAIDWPANGYHLQAQDDTSRASMPPSALVAPNTPLFPSPPELLRYWSGLDIERYGQYWNSVVIILPNFGARIVELQIEAGRLKVAMELGEVSNNDLIGKLYFATSGEQHVCDFSFSDGKASVKTGEVPDVIAVYILSKSTGEVLDFRKSYMLYGESEIDIDPGVADIDLLVSSGEDEHVEFKENLKTQGKIIQTAVAFANTEGGVILVGVDDNGKVVGVQDSKAIETITNLLRTHCEPELKFRIHSVDMRGSTVVMIQVLVGENPPYNYRHNGFFVRVNSTNRHCSRDEIERMLADRAPGSQTEFGLGSRLGFV